MNYSRSISWFLFMIVSFIIGNIVAAQDDSYIKFVQEFSDQPIDIIINNVVIANNFILDAQSNTIAVAPGNLNIRLRYTSTQSEITTHDLNIEGNTINIVILSTASTDKLFVHTHEINLQTKSSASLSILNLIPNSVINAIRNINDEIIFSEIVYNSAIEASTIASGKQKLEASINIDGEIGTITANPTFKTGGYYHMIFMPGSEFTLPHIIIVNSIEPVIETINWDGDYSDIPQARQADGGFVLGNPEAPVTIVAFEDFLCPHCQAYKSVTAQFISQYVATGLARFEYRFLPAVDPTYSTLSAKFAECADILKPGSFWNAHDLMFELASAARFNNSTPRTFAERMDIPYTDLLECSSDEANQVNVDLQLAQQTGATGTPTVMVRYGDSSLQPSPFGQQPSFEQLGVIVTTSGQ